MAEGIWEKNCDRIELISFFAGFVLFHSVYLAQSENPIVGPLCPSSYVASVRSNYRTIIVTFNDTNPITCVIGPCWGNSALINTTNDASSELGVFKDKDSKVICVFLTLRTSAPHMTATDTHTRPSGDVV